MSQPLVCCEDALPDRLHQEKHTVIGRKPWDINGHKYIHNRTLVTHTHFHINSSLIL